MTNTNDRNAQIAQTIIAQMGWETRALTNARDFVYGDAQVQFTVGTKRGGLRKVVVRLDPTDTYTIEAHKINTKTWNTDVRKDWSDVYADNLGMVVEMAARAIGVRV